MIRNLFPRERVLLQPKENLSVTLFKALLLLPLLFSGGCRPNNKNKKPKNMRGGGGRGPTLDPPLFFPYFCALHSWYQISSHAQQ